MINVTKNSRLYNFYKTLSKIMIFSMVTPDSCGSLAVFRDICSFIRINLLYIFVAIPLWIVVLITLVSIPVSLVLSVIEGSMGIMTTAVLVYGLVVATIFLGIFLCMQALKLISKTTESEISTIISESIKSRHDKFCKIIKVVDKKDE